MKAFLTLIQQDWVLLLATSVMVQSSVIIALSLIVSRGVMRHRPAARHACWLVTLFGVLLIPVLTFLVPRTEWSVGFSQLADWSRLDHDLPTPNSSLVAGIPATATERAGEGEPSRVVAGADKASPAVSQHREFSGRVTENLARDSSRHSPCADDPARGVCGLLSQRIVTPLTTTMVWHVAGGILSVSPLGVIAALAWLSGVAVGMAQLLHGVCVVHRLRRSTRPVAGEPIADTLRQAQRVLGMRQLPAVHQSQNVSMPMTVGLRRPIVILPRRMLGMERERLRHVLLHEYAHIARGDAWIGVIQRLTRILFWCQPLVYVLLKQLNRAREELCDNVVLRDSSRQEYAATLLDVASFCRRVPSFPLTFSLFLPRWRLEDRVANLLDQRRDTATRASHGLMLFLLLVFGFVGVALALHAPAATPAQINSRRSPTTFAAADLDNEPIAVRCFPPTATNFLAILNVPHVVSVRSRLGADTAAEGEFLSQLADLFGDYFGHSVAQFDDRLGVPLRRILEATTGEIAICGWNDDVQESSLALVAEVGQERTLNRLQIDIRERFSKQDWILGSREVGGMKVTTYVNTATARKELECFVYNGFLCLTTRMSATGPILERLQKRANDGLITHPDFVEIASQSALPVEETPHLLWYRQPGKDALTRSRTQRRRGVNLSEILDRRLNEVSRAAGGVVSFPADGPRAVLHRSAVLSQTLPELYRQGLQFPSQRRSRAEPWVPADVASYSSFHWRIPESLPLVSSVIDEIVDSEQFTRDVLESIRADPKGPQVNLKTALIPFLGPRVSIASAIGGNPHSWVVAIELQNQPTVAATVDRLFAQDPQVRRHDEAGLTFYELLEDAEQDDSPSTSLTPPSMAMEAGTHPASRISATVVGHGQLFVASRFEDLRRLVAHPPSSKGLRDSPVYGPLRRQLASIWPGESSFQFFSMRGDRWSPPYSFLPHRLAASAGQEPSLRDLLLSRGIYGDLGATTVSIRTTTSGWVAEGCSLSRE